MELKAELTAKDERFREESLNGPMWKVILKIGTPLALYQLQSQAFTILDTMMAAHISEESVSAVAYLAQLNAILLSAAGGHPRAADRGGQPVLCGAAVRHGGHLCQQCLHRSGTGAGQRGAHLPAQSDGHCDQALPDRPLCLCHGRYPGHDRGGLAGLAAAAVRLCAQEQHLRQERLQLFGAGGHGAAGGGGPDGQQLGAGHCRAGILRLWQDHRQRDVRGLRPADGGGNGRLQQHGRHHHQPAERL